MFKNLHVKPVTAGLELLTSVQPLPEDSSLWKTNTPYEYLNHTLIIEYLKGEERVKPTWRHPVPDAYGHFQDIKGADGDELDCYLCQHFDPAASPVIIDQQDSDSKEFDEHKVFLGYANQQDALDTYKKSFGDGKAEQRFKGASVLSQTDFEEWVSSGEVSQPLTHDTPSQSAGVQETLVILPDPKQKPMIVVEDGPKGKVYEIYIMCLFSTDAWCGVTESILHILRSATKDDLVIFGISSGGGELDLATRIAAAMRASDAQIVTMSLGPVASAGCLIWAEGDDRQISSGSYFMQHMSIQGAFGKTNLIATTTTADAFYIKDVVFKRALEVGIFTEQELSDMVDKGTDMFISAQEAAKRTKAELI